MRMPFFLMEARAHHDVDAGPASDRLQILGVARPAQAEAGLFNKRPLSWFRGTKFREESEFTGDKIGINQGLVERQAGVRHEQMFVHQGDAHFRRVDIAQDRAYLPP